MQLNHTSLLRERAFIGGQWVEADGPTPPTVN